MGGYWSDRSGMDGRHGEFRGVGYRVMRCVEDGRGRLGEVWLVRAGRGKYRKAGEAR